MFADPSGFVVTLYSSRVVPEAPEFVLSGTAAIQPVDEGSVWTAGSGVEASVTPSSFRMPLTFPVLTAEDGGQVVTAFREFFLLIHPMSEPVKVARVG